MSWLDTAVSFLAAALTGLGVGSGGLYLLWLTLVMGIGQTKAQGMNLLFCISALSASAAVNAAGKRIPRRPFLLCLLTGLPGAIAGALLAGVIPAQLLRRILGLALIAGGASVLAGALRKWQKKRKKRLFPAKTP